MVKQFVHKMFRSCGYRLIKEDEPRGALNEFFTALKKLDFKPRHLMDIGANHAEWTKSAIEYFPDAQYTLVEPQVELQKYAQALMDAGHKVRFINAGCADVNTTMTLNVAKFDHSSTFVRRENDDTRPVEVPVLTVDSIIESEQLPIPDVLKIDAEGFDLKVIKGATKVLGKAEIVLAECALGCLDFENQLPIMVQTMDAAGYRPIGITELVTSHTHRILWLAELAFIKSNSPMLSKLTHF